MATKILAVDDEPDLEILLRQKFRRQIREGLFEFVFANDGLEAVERLEEDGETDIVLTDINMPRLDGLGLLIKIHEHSPVTKAIIVSAYGDMANIRTAMNRGAFDFVTKPIDFQDLVTTLEKTLEEVNRTKETLKAIKENNILKMYVDDNVLNFMTKHEFQDRLLVNESVEAAVMFIDLCDFTATAENMPADQVVRILNQLFDLIVQEVMEQDGSVDKFIGDGVMTTFHGKHHIDRALDAAIAVRQKLNSLAESSGAQETRPMRVSIGVNCGEVVRGNIGSESLARLDFTVVGDVVNTAARYQSAAAANQILIGEDVYERIRESFACERIGPISLKNKAEPVVVYNVVG